MAQRNRENRYEHLSGTDGRPLKFKSSEEVKEKALRYFEECKEKNEPLTITGLAIALGTFRVVLLDYGNGLYDKIDKEFSSTIKMLKQIVENYAEKRLFSNTPVGAIFALKNYKWTDRVEIDQNININTELKDDQLKRIASRIVEAREVPEFNQIEESKA